MASGGRRRRPKAKKSKKTKYLSLSRHLTKAVDVPPSPDESPPASPPSALAALLVKQEDGGDGSGYEQEHDPFALHPEPSTLFAAAPSLSDILGASSAGGGGGSSCASPDASCGTGYSGEEEDLARRALRGRERWVYCSSSSPSAATTTTTSSSCSSAASTGASYGASARPPLLKLDYEEILAAWAGRGSLYIGGAASPIAPKLESDLELDSVFVEVGPSQQAAAAAAWSAPETTGRAEKVKRYREKRHARLFAKRIRYEVRRLNAVRRPRLKGRFIKESEGTPMVDGGVLHPT